MSGWAASRVLEAFWEYGQPRVKRYKPDGYRVAQWGRTPDRRSDVRFWAWLRVVTEPRYGEFEALLKEGSLSAFEGILAESLRAIPFHPPVDDDGDPGDIRAAFIPVSAACVFAGVSQPTISRWIDRGLRHEKRGAYYWISVSDLERFYEMRGKRKGQAR